MIVVIKNQFHLSLFCFALKPFIYRMKVKGFRQQRWDKQQIPWIDLRIFTHWINDLRCDAMEDIPPYRPNQSVEKMALIDHRCLHLIYSSQHRWFRECSSRLPHQVAQPNPPIRMDLLG
jgi:hypothetical protein